MITFDELGGVEAMVQIAYDIFAVVVKGGVFYVIRLTDEDSSESGQSKGCTVIFKTKLDLAGETRQIIQTLRTLPEYASKIPDKLAELKVE